MKLGYSKKCISLNKELNSLDEFVIKFCNILDEENVKYVVVSGYVAIVFGRSRATEDVDILCEKITQEKFKPLWSKISAEFQCVNANSEAEAWDYLKEGAVRFYIDKPMPNIEFKFPKSIVDEHTIEQRIELKLNGHTLQISPLELQIAFKLYLGADKDIEDARHLYKVFFEKLDKSKLSNYMVLLKVPRQTVDLLEKI